MNDRGQRVVFSLNEKLALFSELWSPRVIGEFNENQISVIGKAARRAESALSELFMRGSEDRELSP